MATRRTASGASFATVLGCDCPRTIEEKRQMLHVHHIALWDAIASCEINRLERQLHP
ncbi:MAG: hypothetical protein ACLU3I_07730 [Acutalibacteraceae bacterium]